MVQEAKARGHSQYREFTKTQTTAAVVDSEPAW
jgi:hypothetical protein